MNAFCALTTTYFRAWTRYQIVPQNVPDDPAGNQRALEKKSRRSNENEDSQNVNASDLGIASSTRTEELSIECTEKPASVMP